MQILGHLPPEVDTVALARAPRSSSDCDDLKDHCLPSPLVLCQNETTLERPNALGAFPGDQERGMQGTAEAASEGRRLEGLLAGGGGSGGGKAKGKHDPTLPVSSHEAAPPQTYYGRKCRAYQTARRRRAGALHAGSRCPSCDRTQRLSSDPAPRVSQCLSSVLLPRGVAQTFPACISHFGRPLFQASKLRVWDSLTRRRLRSSETSTRQNLGLGLGKARGWTRMIFTASSSLRPAATLPVLALLGIAVP